MWKDKRNTNIESYKTKQVQIISFEKMSQFLANVFFNNHNYCMLCHQTMMFKVHHVHVYIHVRD